MPPQETAPQSPAPSKNPSPNLGVPIAIVLAGALIATAVYFSPGGIANNPTKTVAKDVPAVTAADHILGNPNAAIKIVEYTDFECPFCKAFHQTMKKVMGKYGASGQVAWVIRNFPLQELHPSAPALALAAECVASVSGNDAYWKFLDAVFIAAPVTIDETGRLTGNTPFDMTELESIVSSVGVDSAKFKICYDNQTHKEKVQKEFNDAVAAGGTGTPFSVLVDKSGKNTPINGAQPLEAVSALIDATSK